MPFKVVFLKSCTNRHKKINQKNIAVKVFYLTKQEHIVLKLLELVERRNLETFGKLDCKLLEC